MNIKQKAINSTKWSAIQNWTSQILSLLVFLLLARLLQPEDFGLVALASVFVIVLTTLSQQGFAQAIIQREDLEPEHLDSAFWINTSIGVILALGLFFTSPILANIFSQPELSGVLRYLSLTLILNSLTGVHAAILTRKFHFKALALSSIVSSAVGGCVGIYMAYNNFGVWALVGQQLSGAVLGVLVIWFACFWRPGIKVTYRHCTELFSFGSNILGISLLGLVNRRLPDLLIGGFLGPVALGIYTIANRVFTTLTQLLVGTLANIALPTFSRMQSDLGRMRNAYYSAVQLTSIICFPIFTGVLVTAPDLIPAVFGTQWLESAAVSQYLMVVGLLHTVSYFNGPMMMALGYSNIMLRLHLVNTTLNIIAFVVGVHFGIEIVALAFMLRGLMMFPVGQFVLNKYAQISFLTLMLNVKGPAISVLLMAAAVLVVNTLTIDFTVWVRLLLQIGTGGVVYCVTLFVIDRPVINRVLHLLGIAIK
ncbi:MAG: O-antigen/teichoic acid export membrane protein [Paraglaciecola sp.]|jgi:O-antigen/teichoic acid export membrane protein